MIVEPVPTNPRSPARRAIGIAALGVPLVLLVGVVAAGALGPRPAPSTAPAGEPRASAVAGTVPAATAPPPDGAGATVRFPDTWIGIRVRSVAGTRAERAAGGGRGIVAVSGFLDYGSLAWTCVDAYLETDRGACRGRTVLADRPGPAPQPGGPAPAGIGPHLHPVFPPGVRGPAPDDRAGSPRSEPIPVVVLGSFDPADAQPCDPTTGRCDEAFTVDRVVWVAGRPWRPTLTVDPALGVDPGVPEIGQTVETATAALGWGSLALVTAVVRPDALGVIDPSAAAALPPIAERARLRPVTYARGLAFQFDASQPLYGRDPAIAWVVIDSISGQELARGGATSSLPGPAE